MPKRPTIYRLAADRQYGAIPARVESHPDDLQWTDRYGSTALHILCQARVVDTPLLAAVDSILRIAPDQVVWANVATWTPLHFAVEKRLESDANSTALILRLIEACPAAVSVRTQSGFKTKTPFHIACEADAEYLVLMAMLTINPRLATEPYVKKDIYAVVENPLQLLWKNHNHSTSNASSQKQTKEKMALLLKAAHYGTVRPLAPGRSFRLLNAACSVRCPRDYFTRILKEHLDQVGQADENGMLPLHYAVCHATADSQAYTQYVIEALLEACPASASIPDATGRMPLHVAVTSDALLTWHKGGVRELTFSCPNALRKRDPVTNFVPFLASALQANKTRLHLSTTFELLLAAPEMVQSERKAVGSVEDDARLLAERWTVEE